MINTRSYINEHICSLHINKDVQINKQDVYESY